MAEFSTGPYLSPPVATDGTTVVWSTADSREGPDGVAIYGAQLSDRQPFEIVELPDLLTPDVDVDGDLVIWSEDQDGDHDPEVIRAKRLSTGETFTVAESAAETVNSPSVWAGWVVWSVSGPDEASVMARNVDEMGPPVTVATGATGTSEMPGSPRIDEGWVVWGTHYSDRLHAFARFTVQALDAETPVIEDAGYITRDSRPVIENGVLAYSTAPVDVGELPDETAVASTKIVDLATGDTRIVTMTYSIPAESYLPASDLKVATDGRYVFRPFVTVVGTPTSGSNMTVFAYDLNTNSYFRVTSGFIWSLEAADGALVWTNRSGQIHAANLDDRLPTAPTPDLRSEGDSYTYYSETQHYLQYGFKAYWERSGGLPVFGYPMTEEFEEQSPDADTSHTVQYFERQRFEWHPENDGTPYEVLLGRLGDQLLAEQGRDWTTLPKADSNAPHYFAETGHAIGTEFYDYWSQHGLEFGDEGTSFRESLALFGYPISEPIMETNVDGDTVLTQWFERAVFEYHPNNPPESQVLLRRLGAELLQARDW